MSHFTKLKTQIRDKQSLVAALVEMGFSKDQIELHDKPVNLEGYERRGGANPQAEIVIRKGILGNAYNDIGFRLQEDGTYEAMISDMEMHNTTASRNALTKEFKAFGQNWLDKLNQRYALQVVKKTARNNGYSCQEAVEQADGSLVITVERF